MTKWIEVRSTYQQRTRVFVYSGIPGEANRLRLTRPRRAYSLMELLSVLLIMAIVAAIATPTYLSAMADSEKKACRANMQAIANAEEQHKIRTDAHTYTTALSGLAAEMPGLPICPTRGAYSAAVDQTTGRLTISCTVGTHGSYRLGIDNE